MPLIVDEQVAQTNGRLTGVRLTMLTLRQMENLRSSLVDDCEKVLVLLAIVAISAGRFTRDIQLDEEIRDLRYVLPQDRLRQCNISSIAAATGFNRETTRRKVNELVESGLLQRPADGIMRLAPSFVQGPASVDLIRRQLDSIVRVTNELMRDGVIKMD